jgi:hypothetical protein
VKAGIFNQVYWSPLTRLRQQSPAILASAKPAVASLPPPRIATHLFINSLNPTPAALSPQPRGQSKTDK